MMNTAGAEAALGNLESAAFANEKILLRHPDIDKRNLRMAIWGVIITENIEHPFHNYAVGRHRHQDHRLLQVFRSTFVGFAHKDRQFATPVARPCRPPLLAIENIMVIVAYDRGLYI